MSKFAIDAMTDRKSKILSAIIHHYIKTGRPVGSSALIEAYGIALSPATVRNLMAELEKEGYLTQPHTSAGRVPTDKGYRAYVDSLMSLQKLVIKEEEKIKQEYEQKHREIESLLSETSRILSGLSQYTGFVMAPKTQYNEIKNIELVQISSDQLLIILLTHTGMVKHKRVSAALDPSSLNRLRNFLNEKLRGVSLAEANRKIISEIREFKQYEEDMYIIAEKIGELFFGIQDDIYIDGASNAITIPDFNDFEPIRSLIKLNEDKEKLIQILSDDFDCEGINVKIGSENAIEELKNLSMISTVYEDGKRAVGVLGIIGPKRMPYDKMMSLVNTVSKILNEFFKKHGG